MSVVQYVKRLNLSNEYSQKDNELKHAQNGISQNSIMQLRSGSNGTQVHAMGHEGQNSHMQT